MYAPRLNPWDFEDELPPDYDADAAPAYDETDFSAPLMTYSLRQYDRKIQVLVASGTAAKSSYRITTNSFRLFSKKPDTEVLYTSQEMRQRIVAAIKFDNDGPLPWCPRAHFDYTDSNGGISMHTMRAPNFADWEFGLGDRVFEWTIAMFPSSLVLRERGSSVVIARFTYSACGTQAARGGEVGELVVWRDAVTLMVDGMHKLVCSLMVSITHLKRMGRNYANVDGEVVRAASLGRERGMVCRGFEAGVSMV
jgi:hypothetical protein